MNILKDFKNGLLNRREIEFELNSIKTPSLIETTKMIADKFNVSEELMHILGIYGRFGSKNILIKADIYENKEAKTKCIRKSRKQRKAESGAAKPAEEAKKE